MGHSFPQLKKFFGLYLNEDNEDAIDLVVKTYITEEQVDMSLVQGEIKRLTSEIFTFEQCSNTVYELGGPIDYKSYLINKEKNIKEWLWELMEQFEKASSEHLN
jgi:hypothetical protein